MNKRNRFIYLFIFIFVFSAASRAEDIKTIAVAGFINLGDRNDDSINKVISKSLITFLGNIKGTKVTSYEVIEKLAAENKFWESKKLNTEAAVEMALSLAVKQVVTGTYKVNKDKNSIQITVFVYDPVNSELKLKRDYTGSAGLDIFDTIDKLIRNITTELVGHPVVMGSLKLDILSGNSYNLVINKTFQKKVSRQDTFRETEPAEEPLEISLIIPETGSEVYHETIMLKNGEDRVITYTPSGSVDVRTGVSGVKVFADDVPSGETGNNGDLIVRNLKAGTGHTIRTEKDGKILGSKTISIEEGKVYSIDFTASEHSLFFSIHALQGGLGGTLGLDYYFTDYLRASILGGAVSMGGNLLFVADADIGLNVWKMSDIRVSASLGAFCYFTSPLSLSPAVRVEISWRQFFIEGGARYSFDDMSVYPMIGAGIRF